MLALSLSPPVYSNALQESANSILYNGLIEELVDVLQITDKQLVVRNVCVPVSPLVRGTALCHPALVGQRHIPGVGVK